VEVVASLSQDRTAAAQCGLFTYKSVPVIFEPPCIMKYKFACCVDASETWPVNLREEHTISLRVF